MNRIQFIRKLTGGLLLSGFAGFKTIAERKKKAGRKLLYQAHIRGTHYYDAHRCAPMLQLGTALELTREKTNRHDHRAIALYFKNYKLGYIPREDNKILSNMVDHGITEMVAEVAQCRLFDNGFTEISFRLYTV